MISISRAKIQSKLYVVRNVIRDFSSVLEVAFYNVTKNLTLFGVCIEFSLIIDVLNFHFKILIGKKAAIWMIKNIGV